ncbi:hypothetical protein Tco_1145923 [Tanacetum coccineum]
MQRLTAPPAANSANWEIIVKLALYDQKGCGLTQKNCPNPQPQALGTTFEARVRDYMAAHIRRIERFENTIFKQREEINDRMTEMFRLLKELTTSKTPEKVLIREEAKFPVTKNISPEIGRKDKTSPREGDEIRPMEEQKFQKLYLMEKKLEAFKRFS